MEFSYPKLPKELVTVIDSYCDCRGLLSYLTTDNYLLSLQDDIQDIISDYIAPVNKEDLVVLFVMGKAGNISSMEREIINMPYSYVKLDLAFAFLQWQILIDSLGNNSYFPSRLEAEYLFYVYFNKEDYQSSLLIADRCLPFNIENNPLRVTLNKARHCQIRPNNLDWNENERQTNCEDLALLKRQVTFIADTFLINCCYQHLSQLNEYLDMLIGLGWFDVVIKIGKLFESKAPYFFRLTMKHPELKGEFRRRLATEATLQWLVSSFIRESYDVDQHLSILEELGHSDVSSTIKDNLASDD